MKKNYVLNLILTAFFLFQFQAQAQNRMATVEVNDDEQFQKITGFGGFVCSPQFQYGYMSIEEINQLWGADSEMQYNIMRLFIPIGRENWEQSLEAAQQAQSLGLILFASPWSMPAEWKTNNDIAGVVTRDGQEIEGFLKEENYEDYANYLNDYVTYLSDNGVELAGISLQNEPDYQVEYAGCSWTPDQIATFLTEYGDLIDSNIITPETVGFNDTYSQRLAQDDVSDYIDIYAGHQYQSIGNDQELLRDQGKELWMTEYLINWNAGNTNRDYMWEIDAFDFASAINDAMEANISAWVHYASKRYYGMMGDGTNGTIDGEITKRGYILSHYSQYTIGATRIATEWNDDTYTLEGSSYLSEDGETVTIMISNPSEDAYELTADLPFYTTSGTMVTTTEDESMVSTAIDIEEESFRPEINIAASSFTTLQFTRSSERPDSQMTGEAVHYNLIEDQNITNEAFGTGYQLSNSTTTLDVNTPLISSNTSANNGYVALDDRYNRFVLHVDAVTSANQYVSANTTLNYINSEGNFNSYNYGEVEMPRGGDFDLVFDISSDVLTDGCIGIVSITNSNYSSVLTIEFGDVYFNIDDEKAFAFSGTYSDSDSDLLNYLDDMGTIALDFTETEGVNAEQNWREDAINKNSLFYVADDVDNTNTNVISGTSTAALALDASSGDFYVPVDFTTSAASFEVILEGTKMMILPFASNIPEGISAYTLQYESAGVQATLIEGGEIPANTPLIVLGSGSFVFEGSGSVSTPKAINVNEIYATYIEIDAPVGSYYLDNETENPVLRKVVDGEDRNISPFTAYLPGITEAEEVPITFSNLSTEAFKRNSAFIFFPNPVQDVLQLRSANRNVVVTIYDMYGNTVIEPFSLSERAQVNVSNLSQGIYIISAEESGKIVNRKFIKE